MKQYFIIQPTSHPSKEIRTAFFKKISGDVTVENVLAEPSWLILFLKQVRENDEEPGVGDMREFSDLE